MYYENLIDIKYEATEITQSKRKDESFVLRPCTIDELDKAINKHVKSLKEKGMTLFRLEFICDEGNEEEEDVHEVRCCVKGSRMETEDETQERITRNERFNRNISERIAAEKENIERRRELNRIAGHLTLEQLKAIESMATPAR